MIQKLLKTVSSAAWPLLVFLLVLIGSLLYHLPASWVFKQMDIQSQLPKSMQLSEPQGTLWNGRTQLRFSQSPQSVFAAELDWQLSPWALLMMNANLSISLNNALGGASWKVNTGLLDQNQIELSDLDGQWQLAALQPFLPNAVRGFGQLKGQLTLQKLAMIWDGKQNWLTAVEGELQISGMDFMGMKIPSLKVKPEMKNQQVALNLIGGGAGWELSGNSLLGAKTFQHDLKIQADNAKSMPDWVDLMMRKKTPVLATLVQKGRW